MSKPNRKAAQQVGGDDSPAHVKLRDDARFRADLHDAMGDISVAGILASRAAFALGVKRAL